MIEAGVSDAFCAFKQSFNTRNAKILFDETLFEKGKMFSLADGDFKVSIFENLLWIHLCIISRYQNLVSTIFKYHITVNCAEL